MLGTILKTIHRIRERFLPLVGQTRSRGQSRSPNSTAVRHLLRTPDSRWSRPNYRSVLFEDKVEPDGKQRTFIVD